VNALVAVIHNGGVVTNALADLGEVAVPAVVEALVNPDRLKRSGAARTLGLMASRAKPLGLSDHSLTAMRLGLLKAAHNERDFILRKNAVEALIWFPHNDIRPLMERLASSDDYGTMERGTLTYPVRDGARNWLAKHVRRTVGSEPVKSNNILDTAGVA
jgi:HEAT repeat protein